MSKKFGKFLLFSAVAGAAAYGAYHYFQTKDETPSSNNDEDNDDDFDDFSEDLDDDTTETKERSYVSLNLDKAEAIAAEAFHKAKEVITDSVQQVKDTVKSVTEGQGAPESSFTDLTAINKEKTKAETPQETSADDAAQSETHTENIKEEAEAVNTAEERVEEFYDDEQ